MRLKIPGFASTLMGAVACSAVAIVTPQFEKIVFSQRRKVAKIY
jgi:hypothetical protein